MARSASSRVSNHEARGPSLETPLARLLGMRSESSLRKPWRALFHIGAHGLGLVGAAEQLLLLDGFGEQRRARIDGQIVQHALGGADCIRALAGDFARNLESGGARIVADPGREAIAHGFLRREDAAGV